MKSNFSTLLASAAPFPKVGKRQGPASKLDTPRGSHLSSDAANQSQGPPKSQRESAPAPLLAHTGDLVICKKKRKDGEKPSGKYAVGTPPSSNWIGPLNPGRMGPVSPAANSSGKVQGLHFSGTRLVSGGVKGPVMLMVGLLVLEMCNGRKPPRECDLIPVKGGRVIFDDLGC